MKENKRNANKITIDIMSILTSEEYEKLEDKMRNFFENEGIHAIIENEATGNTTTTRLEIVRKKLFGYVPPIESN